MSGRECAERTELLLEYSRGGLLEGARAELEEHLRACPGCREFAARQREVWSALDGWEAPGVSAGFDQRLYSRIERAPWFERLLRLVRPALVRRVLPAVAVAGLAVVAVLVTERSRTVAPPPAPPAVNDSVSDEGLDNALEELEILREFNGLMRPDAPEAKI